MPTISLQGAGARQAVSAERAPAQLHASVDFVVGSARTSCASAKSAELANASLQALAAHGIAQNAQFWPGFVMPQ